MKRFAMMLAALLLCFAGAFAQSNVSTAVVKQETPLLNAPDGDVLMRYYIGTRVTVLGNTDAEYVQVAVGEGDGNLTGYMAAYDLALTEREARMVHPDVVEFYANAQPCNLYSQPDTDSKVIEAAFYVEDSTALGYKSGEWLHVRDDYGRMGFISRKELTITREEHHASYTIEVEWMEGDLTEEDAIAEAKRRILADHESGENLNIGMDDVTAEGLDACPVSVKIQTYEGIASRLFYDVEFIDVETGYCYAWVTLEVEGENVLSHTYGNG